MSGLVSFLTETEVVRTALAAHGVLDGTKPTRIPTGLPCIDESIGGLTPGDMKIIAARPGCGKSTFLMHQMRAAVRAGYKAGFISLEDTATVCGERLQAYYSHVGALEIRRNGPSHKEVRDVLAKTDMDNMLFSFPTTGDILEIGLTISEMAQKGVKVVAIDYLTAILPSGTEDLRSAYSKILIQLKSYARKFDVVIILAAQIARPKWSEKMGRYVEEPSLSEIGESSFAERIAELVVMLWKEKGIAYGKLAKSKFGGEMFKFAVSLNSQGLLETEVINDQ